MKQLMLLLALAAFLPTPSSAADETAAAKSSSEASGRGGNGYDCKGDSTCYYTPPEENREAVQILNPDSTISQEARDGAGNKVHCCAKQVTNDFPDGVTGTTESSTAAPSSGVDN